MKIKSTQGLIIESLIGLMTKYSYESISIAKITQNALVARNSFYRNFSSKEEVLRLHLRIIIDEYSKTLNRPFYSHFSPVERTVSVFLPFFRTYSEFLLLLHRNNLTFIIIDEFSEYLKQLIRSRELGPERIKFADRSDEAYFVTFHSSGLCYFLLKWLQEGSREPEELMTRLLKRTLEFGVLSNSNLTSRST